MLFISGYVDDVLTRKGVLEPNVELMHKPLTLSAIAHKVREVLDSAKSVPD